VRDAVLRAKTKFKMLHRKYFEEYLLDFIEVFEGLKRLTVVCEEISEYGHGYF